jgi:hypothetical protein
MAQAADTRAASLFPFFAISASASTAICTCPSSNPDSEKRDFRPKISTRLAIWVMNLRLYLMISTTLPITVLRGKSELRE